MALWHWVVMVCFSCAALIISLYCLFFMVPVRRFLAHIRSLGGGMKGMEAHLESMREEVSARLAELETSTQDQVAQAQEAAESALEKVSEESREARRELNRVRKNLQSLQAELRETAADSSKVSRGASALTTQLQQLRKDFDVLDIELRRSVQREVANSFSSVESTVLSALEAIQGEIVYGTARPSDGGNGQPPEQPRTRTATPFGRSSERRMSEQPKVQPLFPELQHQDAAPTEKPDTPGDSDADPGTGGEDEPNGSGDKGDT